MSYDRAKGGTDRHVTELCVTPAIHPPLATEHRYFALSARPDESEPIASQQADLTIRVHLEEHRPTAVNEQVRVLG